MTGRPCVKSGPHPYCGYRWLWNVSSRPTFSFVEVWPNLGAATTATTTDEPWLEIGEPYAVRPKVGVQSDVMAAMAISQHAANAHLAHLAEGDFHGPAVGVRRRVLAGRGMLRSKRYRTHLSNYRFIAARNEREPLQVVVWKS